MNRLARAAAEMRAALIEERERIDRALKDLDAWEAADAAVASPATKRRRVVRRVEAKASGKLSPSERARRGAEARWAKKPKAHGVPGKPGTVAGDRTDRESCESCGRDDVGKSPGPGGYMRFHRAPKCGLVCAAVNLDRVDPEDKTEGLHSKRNCPKCSKAVATA